jgi:hypothetical protein
MPLARVPDSQYQDNAGLLHGGAGKSQWNRSLETSAVILGLSLRGFEPLY